jgi:hypothetical protein
VTRIGVPRSREGSSRSDAIGIGDLTSHGHILAQPDRLAEQPSNDVRDRDYSD